MALDKRIGVRNADYSINNWPELSINGCAYERPCRMIGLGNGHFCVIDNFPLKGWREEVDALKASIKGMGAAPSKGVNNGPKRTSEES